MRARGTRIVGAGTRLSVVMSSRFFSVKNATFSSFLMRMVSHLVFTMKTTVYHEPHGRPFHIIELRSDLAKAEGSGTP